MWVRCSPIGRGARLKLEATRPKAPGRVPWISFSSWNKPRLKLVPYLLRYMSQLVSVSSPSVTCPRVTKDTLLCRVPPVPPQGPPDTSSSLGPSSNCVSLLLHPELLGNEDCAFPSSVVLAQAREQQKVGIKVMVFEVNQIWVRVPALPPPDSAAWPASFLCLSKAQFPERSLERVIRKKE